jgi:hypothetical protein
MKDPLKHTLALLSKHKALRLIPAALSLYTALLVTQLSNNNTPKELKPPYHQLATAPLQLEDTQESSNKARSNESWEKIVYGQSQLSLVSQIIDDNNPDHPHRDSIAKTIITEGQRAQIDPLLIAAVVHTESTFKLSATSPRGAKGLMQIMPQTGRYVAKINKIKYNGSAALNDPQLNIRLGVLYLKQLQERFKGDLDRTLVAYNWGPTNLMRALANGASFPKESQSYVRKVREHHALWSAKLIGARVIGGDRERRVDSEQRLARIESGLVG